jgi:hypothetical protein
VKTGYLDVDEGHEALPGSVLLTEATVPGQNAFEKRVVFIDHFGKTER